MVIDTSLNNQLAKTSSTQQGNGEVTLRPGIRVPPFSGSVSPLPERVSEQRSLIDMAYRSSWLVGAAVDTVAEDMTRNGITITSTLEPDAKQHLQGVWASLALWNSLNNVIKQGRLYGSALGVILLDGDDMSTPLRVDTVKVGAFRGIVPVNRWQVSPSLSDRESALGPDLGQPRFYQVTDTSSGIPPWKIHYSRVIRIDGITLPSQFTSDENGWGISVIERIYDRILAFDSATTAAVQLMNKAHLRTYSVADLRKILAMGGPAREALLAQMTAIQQGQSIDGLTLMDASDKFETHAYHLNGLPEVLAQFAQQLSGALNIPLVRLFGQSPAGFTTGDVDLANYYDGIAAQQARQLRRPVYTLMSLLHRSVLGKPLPDNFAFSFNPLWQMSELDRSKVAMQTVEAIGNAVNSGVMTAYAGAEQLRDSSPVTGIGSTIRQEDLASLRQG
ncbi:MULTISPECIES: DUF1073 domain-containing protein [unclassified Serratia (in: enterobacteria)]|uniref:DUF1073 domain-containing protein n=1 Tax=unclassified Serratia (in: enterobacteria) TaxID=2647522 RepID=UPI000907A7BE|nr:MULTISPECIES: DUF1073 domain-containing protein [unclassified Serratia (in: enterobacteria)]